MSVTDESLPRLFFLLFLVFSLTGCDLWDDMVDSISGSGDDKDIEKVAAPARCGAAGWPGLIAPSRSLKRWQCNVFFLVPPPGHRKHQTVALSLGQQRIFLLQHRHLSDAVHRPMQLGCLTAEDPARTACAVGNSHPTNAA